MKTNRSARTLMAAASLAVLMLGASGAAHAYGDTIYWSIGMSSSGVQVGLASAPPVFVPAHPVYVAPPRPVVLLQPAPVYYAQPYAHRGWSHHNHGRHVGYGRVGEAYGHGNDRYERGHERGREGHGHNQHR